MNIFYLSLLDSVQSSINDYLHLLAERGHSVYFLYPHERRTRRKTAFRSEGNKHFLGIKTLNITKVGLLEKGLATLLLERQFIAAIRRYLGKVKADLVLYNTPPITLYGAVRFLKRRDGAVTYLMLKDIFPQNSVDLGMLREGSLMYRFFRRKEERLYAVSDHIGCMSPANVDYLLRHNPSIPPAKVELNPNTMRPTQAARDPARAADIRRQYGVDPGAALLLYGGNLAKSSGVGFLLDVLAACRDRADLFFLIVGAGTEYGRIKNWMAEHKPRNALLRDYMPKAEYEELTLCADIGLILLDRRFTIPNYPSRLLACLNASLPVLCATDVNTDAGSIAEANGYGTWCQNGDLPGFERALRPLLDPETRRRMGEAGRAYLLAHYTPEVNCDAIMKHFARTGPAGGPRAKGGV